MILDIGGTLYSFFVVIWGALDQVFTYIDSLFRGWFDAIPDVAIPYLIGIICYSALAYLEIYINMQKLRNKEAMEYFLRSYHGFLLITVICFSIWRLGIINQIDPNFTVQSLSEWIVNIVYILFGIVIIVAFFRKITWLKNALLILLWSLFLALTFIIAPALEEFEPNSSTLTLVAWIGVIFLVPNVAITIQNKRVEQEQEILEGDNT